MNIFCNLPPELPKEEQKILLDKLPDLQAKKDLIEGNLRLVFYIAKQFSNVDDDIEDLFSAGTIGLIKSIDAFKIDKNVKLSTFAGQCIRNEILMYLRTQRKHIQCLSLNQPLYNDSITGSAVLVEDICADSKSSSFFDLCADMDSFLSALSHISNCLFEKSYRNFVMFFYMLGKENQEYVGKVLNVSQSYVSRSFKKFHNQLISLSKSERYLVHPNYFIFFFKDDELYLGISKMILDDTALNLFSCKEINDNYFFVTFPFDRESFIDIAEMFRQLHDLHMILDLK